MQSQLEQLNRVMLSHSSESCTSYALSFRAAMRRYCTRSYLAGKTVAEMAHGQSNYRLYLVQAEAVANQRRYLDPEHGKGTQYVFLSRRKAKQQGVPCESKARVVKNKRPERGAQDKR